jgi:hypothetical protein
MRGDTRETHVNRTRETQLDGLRARGFLAHYLEASVSIIVRCTGCEALVINGTPTHEHGCPNAVHECKGCNALIPMNQRYCEECR